MLTYFNSYDGVDFNMHDRALEKFMAPTEGLTYIPKLVHDGV